MAEMVIPNNEKADSEDELILVDILDQEIGHAGKMHTHVEGLLHRAFSVFLIHEDKMLIQQRAFDKYHSGGLWANACCSHPRYGESLKLAVQRRLMQELGIETRVEEVASFVYYSKYSEKMHEYEYDHVFLGDYEGEFVINPEEIADTKWVTLDWLKEDLAKNPDRYSSWFLIAAPMVFRYMEGRR